jgi:hypothetical protein
LLLDFITFAELGRYRESGKFAYVIRFNETSFAELKPKHGLFIIEKEVGMCIRQC